MDAADRALLDETVRDAVTRAAVDSGGGSVDDTLTELGWLEMLEAEPRDAVEIVFAALGANNAVATALDDVVAAALGITARPDLAVLLPPFATWTAPAFVDGARLVGVGLMTTRVATAAEVLVAGRGDGESWIATVPMSAVDATPVQGVDPAGGLHVRARRMR